MPPRLSRQEQIIASLTPDEFDRWRTGRSVKTLLAEPCLLRIEFNRREATVTIIRSGPSAVRATATARTVAEAIKRLAGKLSTPEYTRFMPARARLHHPRNEKTPEITGVLHFRLS